MLMWQLFLTCCPALSVGPLTINEQHVYISSIAFLKWAPRRKMICGLPDECFHKRWVPLEVTTISRLPLCGISSGSLLAESPLWCGGFVMWHTWCVPCLGVSREGRVYGDVLKVLRMDLDGAHHGGGKGRPNGRWEAGGHLMRMSLSGLFWAQRGFKLLGSRKETHGREIVHMTTWDWHTHIMIYIYMSNSLCKANSNINGNLTIFLLYMSLTIYHLLLTWRREE